MFMRMVILATAFFLFFFFLSNSDWNTTQTFWGATRNLVLFRGPLGVSSKIMDKIGVSLYSAGKMLRTPKMAGFYLDGLNLINYCDMSLTLENEVVLKISNVTWLLVPLQ